MMCPLCEWVKLVNIMWRLYHPTNGFRSDVHAAVRLKCVYLDAAVSRVSLIIKLDKHAGCAMPNQVYTTLDPDPT